jgi:hypothetical protein
MFVLFRPSHLFKIPLFDSDIPLGQFADFKLEQNSKRCSTLHSFVRGGAWTKIKCSASEIANVQVHWCHNHHQEICPQIWREMAIFILFLFYIIVIFRVRLIKRKNLPGLSSVGSLHIITLDSSVFHHLLKSVWSSVGLGFLDSFLSLGLSSFESETKKSCPFLIL